MKNIQQQVTAAKNSGHRYLLASGFLALMLLAPLANAADKTDDKKTSEDKSNTQSTASSYTGARINTIVIGGSAGSMSVNSAAGATAITTTVIQEQSIASPYK